MNNLLAFLIILVIVIYLYAFSCNNEYFSNERYGDYCIGCGEKNFSYCMECANCGYCLKPRGGKCVQGDTYGPWNKNEKCLMWYHNDPYSRMNYYGRHPLNDPIIQQRYRHKFI